MYLYNKARKVAHLLFKFQFVNPRIEYWLREKKEGRRGVASTDEKKERKVSRNVRANLLRALYICTYYIYDTEVWLSHAFKFVCRNGARRLLMPSVTLLGGRI